MQPQRVAEIAAKGGAEWHSAERESSSGTVHAPKQIVWDKRLTQSTCLDADHNGGHSAEELTRPNDECVGADADD